MILTILNYDTSDIHILKYDDNLDEIHCSPEEFIKSLDYNLNNISYMYSDNINAFVYNLKNSSNKTEIARFSL